MSLELDGFLAASCDMSILTMKLQCYTFKNVLYAAVAVFYSTEASIVWFGREHFNSCTNTKLIFTLVLA